MPIFAFEEKKPAIDRSAYVSPTAVISDDAEVGAGTIVGEMGLVKRGQAIPSRKVAVGVPARVIGDVGDRLANMTHRAKEIYVDLTARYNDGGLVEVDP